MQLSGGDNVESAWLDYPVRRAQATFDEKDRLHRRVIVGRERRTALRPSQFDGESCHRIHEEDLVGDAFPRQRLPVVLLVLAEASEEPFQLWGA